MKPSEIKNIRERLNLTQEEFALSIGLASKNVISNLETGFRNPSGIVVRLLRLLEHLPLEESRELVAKLKLLGEKGRTNNAES
ncbi:MAG: helix-turn-helix transcriptional regulator [Pseudobdellovibrionaceae bacterium]|nr:helix-turn-helix transcriptional regulator [Pseudobdellovibrionaceae bacterium]